MKNLTKRFTSLVLAFSIMVGASGCTKKRNDNDENELADSVNTKVSSTSESAEISLSEDDEPVMVETFAISDEELDEFILSIDSITPNYNYEYYYPTDEDIEALLDKIETTKECNYVFDNDIEKLLIKLKKNSADFVLENNMYVYPFLDDSFSSLYSSDRECFDLAFKNIVQELVNSTNNVSEDICVLKDYKIVFSYEPDDSEYSYVLAYTHNGEKIMVLYPDRIREYANNPYSDVTFVEQLETTIRHEINHVRQYSCECRINNGQQYYQVGNSSITESSAESAIQYINKHHAESTYMASYCDERQKEALLLALGLFQDKTAEDYYNAVFDCDYQKFNDFFGVDSKEEAKAFANILYAIDALCDRNNMFFEVCNKDLIRKEDFYDTVGYGYKVEFFKMILKNMIYYTLEHGEFDVKENLVLFNVIKSLIVDEPYFKRAKSSSYDDERACFASDINFLENKYIEFLSLHYNMDIFELRNMEEDWVSWELLYINKIYDGNFSDIDNEYAKKAKSIIIKFPLLGQIMPINTVYHSDYVEFMEENDIVLTLNKSKD